MQTRIYRVLETLVSDMPPKARLVEASSPAQALRHVVAPRFKVDVPTTKDVAELMSGGAKVEQAGENTEP